MDVQCLDEMGDEIDDITTLIVHRDNAWQWQQAIAKFGSRELRAKRLQVVGVRSAMEALEHAATGLGINGVQVDLPPLTRME